MSKKYYKKGKNFNKKLLTKSLSLGILTLGILIICYVLFPLISWQVYFAPVFAKQNILSPIPKVNIVNEQTMASLFNQISENIKGVDYENINNWFPDYSYPSINSKLKIESYFISIPALNIKNAVVSAVNTDLSKHLVNYPGTPLPPEKGNPVIFGHSTLPQLYNPKDYKTIFANAYKLKMGDEIFVNINTLTYRYKIINITVVDPKDTSVFEQNINDSYLTLITCTPPGTVWKRLVIKSLLQKVE